MADRILVIENKHLFRMLGRVALPIALQSLISSSLTLVDNLMVGRLGVTELAATGIATQYYYIHWMILFGFCSGCATFMSQFWGVQDLKSIRKTIGFAITVCTIASLCFFLAAVCIPQNVMRLFTDKDGVMGPGIAYIRTASVGFLCTCIIVPFTTALRSTQQASLPLKISAAAFITNTILNYTFIFGNFGAPQLGVMGAALATSIARVLELSLCLYVVFGRKNILSGKLSEFFGWSRNFIVNVLKNTFPTTINETLWGLGVSAYIAVYGRVSESAAAVITACNVINNMFILAIFSLGDACLILVGQQLGKGEMDYAYALSKKIMKTAVLIGIAAGSLLILFSRLIIGFYSFNAEEQQLAFAVLMIYGCAVPLRAYGGLHVTGTLRAGGDTPYAMFTELSCLWLIGVPLVYLGALQFHLPIYLVVLMSEAESLVKGVILHRRYVSKKWLRNMITNM